MNMDKYHKHAHHIMNFEIPPESSLIKKYVCRPPDRASIAPTSNATMRDVTLQSIWIENGRNIAWNNCLQVSKLPSWRLLIYKENMTLYISTVNSRPIIWMNTFSFTVIKNHEINVKITNLQTKLCMLLPFSKNNKQVRGIFLLIQK